MLIKGESSYWINKNELLKSKFEWQDEHIATSVSESNIDKVRMNIQNQKEHHRNKFFSEEYNNFLKKFNLDNINI